MDRRAFLATLAGGLLAAHLWAEAQQPPKVARLVYLGTATPTTPDLQRTWDEFVGALRDHGYVEGQNLVIERRYAEGRMDRFPALAREVVRLSPDVIVVGGDQATKAVKEATSTIPIVMIACDALAAGLVDSLSRPSGNVTGVTCLTAELAAKRLEILREMRPGLSRVAVLWNPGDPGKVVEWREIQKVAPGVGVQLHSEEVREAAALAGAFARMRGVDALVTLADSFTVVHRGTIVSLASSHRLPAVYGFRDFVVAGGLLSYGPSLADMFGAAGRVAARILKGAKPVDLPVEQPTKYELVINLKTAKALGLTIPPSLLQRADQVIE
jgi:putative tryptophan/tyrosine transport system substrate-binding protein